MGTMDERGIFRLNVVANQRKSQTNYMLQKQTYEETIHVTDEHKTFTDIEKLSDKKQHYTVNHSGTLHNGICHYFVDPNTGFHNNTVECLFSWLKKIVARYSTMNLSTHHFARKIAEVSFRYNKAANYIPQVFLNFLIAIVHVYPVYGDRMTLFVICLYIYIYICK